MALCQPVMLLTQAALALGVTDAALTSVGDALRDPAYVLATQYEALSATAPGITLAFIAAAIFSCTAATYAG
jgi:hypothetical protein